MSLKDRLRHVRGLHTAVLIADKYKEVAGSQLAAAIAFFGFLSLFPLLLLALSVAGYFLAADPTRQTELAAQLIGAVPGLGTKEMLEVITAVVEHRTATGFAGLAGVLWSGLRVMDSASVATTLVLGGNLADEKFVRSKARSVVVLLVLGAVAALGVIAGGIAGLDLVGAWQVVATVGGLVVSIALDFTLFLVAYRLLAARPGPPWTVVVPGALLGATGWTALKLVGSTYVESAAASAGAAYGSLAWVIAAMLLLYLAARLYIYGAVFNAVRAEQRAGSRPDVSVRPQPAAAIGQHRRDTPLQPVTIGPAEQTEAGSLRVSLRPALALLLTGGALAAVYRVLR